VAVLIPRPTEPHRTQTARASLALVAGALLPITTLAAPPEIKSLFPLGILRGKLTTISLGKMDTSPRVWTNCPGAIIQPTPAFGVYHVEIPADATPGPYLLRAWNDEGASAPKAFFVTREPELRAIEPNDLPAKPQPIAALPAIISGQLEKAGDVDGFGVTLKRGQTLVASVQSHVFGSTLDPLTRITDATGRVQGFNHDSRTLDPFLAWEAPHDGTFTVQVFGFAYPAQASVQLTGGETCFYRLHLSAGPTVRATAPLHVQAGTKTNVHLTGWNLPATTREVDATALTAGTTMDAPFGDELRVLAGIPISAHPEKLEPENPAPDELLALPVGITGRIRTPREEDHYRFSATKGKAYEITVAAAPVGSTLDPWVAISNGENKEVARNDDSAGRDARLTWTAPADGVFSIGVGDLTHRGGEGFLYRLAVAEAAPSVSATLAAHSYTVTPGKTSDVKVTVKRAYGFKAPLELTAVDLPPGVTAPPVEVPEKDGEVTLKLTAEPTSAKQGQPVRIRLREKGSDREHAVQHMLVATSENNGVPQGYPELVIPSTDVVWLTVTAPETPKP
jgi:hypothetical protein